MPYVNFALAGSITQEQMEKMKSEVAGVLKRNAGKEENWLYVRFQENQNFYFQGRKVENGGMIEVKLVGNLAGFQKAKITSEIGKLLEEELGTPTDKFYVIFTEVKGENWGWDGQTFG